jgi:hypothetical protein
MSRIEDALKKARFIRSLLEKNESTNGTPDADSHDNGIDVLVISDDLSISCLVRNLQSLSQAEVIVSNNIAHGMRTLLEQRPIAVDDFELRFTAFMLDTLCCCYGREAKDVSTG